MKFPGLGIIIPYRDREDHLRVSTPVLSRFGKVYVIEQCDTKPFNRGKLINIGYKEFKKEFDYFLAHDVDMIPENIDYSFCENPCHLATFVEQFNYVMPYKEYFGGVTLFPNKWFEKANGFNNDFYGWGGEDDEIRRRLIEMGATIQSRECRFKSLYHVRKIDNTLRAANRQRLKEDIVWGNGLTSCRYDIIHCEDFDNYTLLQVSL